VWFGHETRASDDTCSRLAFSSPYGKREAAQQLLGRCAEGSHQRIIVVSRTSRTPRSIRDISVTAKPLAEVEWHPATVRSFGGEATVFRGHIGIRELFRDLYEAFGVSQAEYWEIRDLGDRIVALGHWITRGEGSGAEIATPLGLVADFRNGKVIRVRTYLDRQQALEAVGLRH
jgi:ketosteroid isomerase-like protein